MIQNDYLKWKMYNDSVVLYKFKIFLKIPKLGMKVVTSGKFAADALDRYSARSP